MFTTFSSSFTRTAVGTVGMAFCAGLCLVGATAPAHAATFGATAPAHADTVRTATVSYADLDVAHAQGRAALDRRLHIAARAVCSSSQESPAARANENRCVRAALSNARPVVD